jgi:hypothetical protein
VIHGHPGRGQCQVELSPLVQETARAVAIGWATRERTGGWWTVFSRPSYCYDAGGYGHVLRVELSRPLGDRVVFDWTTGSPLSAS